MVFILINSIERENSALKSKYRYKSSYPYSDTKQLKEWVETHKEESIYRSPIGLLRLGIHEDKDREVAKLKSEINELNALYDEKLKEFEQVKNIPEEAKNIQHELEILSMMIRQTQMKLSQLTS